MKEVADMFPLQYLLPLQILTVFLSSIKAISFVLNLPHGVSLPLLIEYSGLGLLNLCSVLGGEG